MSELAMCIQELLQSREQVKALAIELEAAKTLIASYQLGALPNGEPI